MDDLKPIRNAPWALLSEVVRMEPQGLKPVLLLHIAARLKPCPDTNLFYAKCQMLGSVLCHALALAANQYSHHLMSRRARFGYIAVGAMPACMICVMAGGPSFSGIALSTRSSMQNGLVRAGGPVLIDIVFAGSDRNGTRGTGHQSDIGGDLLEF